MSDSLILIVDYIYGVIFIAFYASAVNCLVKAFKY